MSETFQPNSTWLDPPTPAQIRAITRMCIYLRIREPLEERVSTRKEARDLIYELRARLNGRRAR